MSSWLCGAEYLNHWFIQCIIGLNKKSIFLKAPFRSQKGMFKLKKHPFLRVKYLIFDKPFNGRQEINKLYLEGRLGQYQTLSDLENSVKYEFVKKNRKYLP